MKKLNDNEFLDEQIEVGLKAIKKTFSLTEPDLIRELSIAGKLYVESAINSLAAKNKQIFDKKSDKQALEFEKQMSKIQLEKAKK